MQTTETTTVTETSGVTTIEETTVTEMTEAIPNIAETTSVITTEQETTTAAMRVPFTASEDVETLLKEASNWNKDMSMAGSFIANPIYVDSELEVYAIGSRYIKADVGVYFYDVVNKTVYKDTWGIASEDADLEFESEVAKYKYDKENGLFYTYIDYQANSINHLGISVFNIKENKVQDQCFMTFSMGESLDTSNFTVLKNTVVGITTPQELVTYTDTLNLVECATIYID